MAQEFPGPRVVGEIPIQELSDFGLSFPNMSKNISFPDPNRANFKNDFIKRLSPIANRLISIAEENDFNPRHPLNITLDTHLLRPSHAQRIGAQRWHQDGTYEGKIKLVVSDRLPTEFLVGQIEDRTIRKHGLPSGNKDSDRQELYKELKHCTDDDLAILGLSRVIGKPGEVMLFTGKNVHRSPAFSGDKPIRRTWFRASYFKKKRHNH